MAFIVIVVVPPVATTATACLPLLPSNCGLCSTVSAPKTLFILHATTLFLLVIHLLIATAMMAVVVTAATAATATAAIGWRAALWLLLSRLLMRRSLLLVVLVRLMREWRRRSSGLLLGATACSFCITTGRPSPRIVPPARWHCSCRCDERRYLHPTLRSADPTVVSNAAAAGTAITALSAGRLPRCQRLYEVIKRVVGVVITAFLLFHCDMLLVVKSSSRCATSTSLLPLSIYFIVTSCSTTVTVRRAMLPRRLTARTMHGRIDSCLLWLLRLLLRLRPQLLWRWLECMHLIRARNVTRRAFYH